MSDWILLNNEEIIKERIKQLKRENRGDFVTNYQLINSGLDYELNYTEIFFREFDNDIYIIKREDEFYKLYYALTGLTIKKKVDLNEFPKSVRNGILVFDVIELEGKEKQTEAVKFLKEEIGFQHYKTYHMWECMKKGFKMPLFRKYTITDDKDLRHLSRVYDIFDVYSDMLPAKRMFKDYINNRYSFSVFCDNRYEGSQIYHVNGNVVEGDFVYALNKGSGIGGILLMKLIERSFVLHDCTRLKVWIDDGNNESIEMHKSAGFIRTSQYKMTFIKEM